MTAIARRLPAIAASLMLAQASLAQRPRTTSDERQTLKHAGKERTYVLRVPKAVASSTAKVPLVIVLHGGGGNGGNAESMTGFTPKASAEGFIVVYPEGTSRGRARLLTWNAGHCCGYALESRADDVGFIDALIGHLVSNFPVDPKRVFVTGMSNGAMMAHRVGRELSGRVAAIAPVVGGLFGDEQPGPLGVSALMINGMRDGSVPYEGGKGGGRFPGAWDDTPLKPALYQATYWAAANGCQLQPTTEDTRAFVHHRHHCQSPVGVELYAVKDGGHAWPGGQRGTRRGADPGSALNATDVIWAFFAAHPKN